VLICREQYGSIRVYEWGPEDGPRVLFIHGINTTCQTLGKLAHALVKKGCRVMLFVRIHPFQAEHLCHDTN
jgi:signal recognition particle GTPase